MKLIKTLLTVVAIATASSFASVAFADAADMTNAEVRKVDREAKKITLKHEDIKNLDMPGMTMVFQVKDAALLDKAKTAEDFAAAQLAIDANIHGARHVADLAALTPSGRYVHCSTCFVAGMKSGTHAEAITPGVSPNGTVFDAAEEVASLEVALRALPSKADRLALGMARAQRLGWPNVYTFSKALSEHLLEVRDDVRTTTVRPAIVECADRYPFAGWNEGINTSGPLVWLMGTAFRRLPVRNSVGFDIIPVDMVCRGTMLAPKR